MKTKCPLPKGFSGTRAFSGILVGLLALTLTSVSAAVAAPFAYVSNFSSNTVSVINAATNTVIATIPVGEQPWGVVVNPGGTRAYVANSNSFGNGVPSVSVIDTTTNIEIARITGVGAQPSGVAVSGSRVYVANGDGTVAVIDGVSNTLVPPTLIPGVTRGMLGGLVVAGSSVYVADHASASVLNVLDSTAAPIFQGFSLKSIAASGSRVYVVSADVFDDLELWVIDTGTNTISGPVSIGTTGPTGNASGRGLAGIAVSPSGSFVYVTIELENTVWVFDASGNFVATVGPGLPPFFNAPFGVAVEGAHVFVVNSGSGSVTVLDGSNAFVASVPVGSLPLVFGAFATAGAAAPPDTDPTPDPAPPSCDAKIAELQKKVKTYKYHYGYAKLKTALRLRASALSELEKAKAKVGGSDKRILRAKKEFDRGDAALCANRYWRAAHEYWEAYEIAHRILKHYRYHRR